jgi:hypothetical protein
MKGSLIVTKYYGPTNTRSSRIKATTASGLTHWVSWDYDLDVNDNHNRAAMECYNRNLIPHVEFIDGRRGWVQISRDLPNNAGIVHIVDSVAGGL